MKKVILISGRMRTGKNQFAEYLKNAFEAKGIKVGTDLFAKDLKDGCREDFKKLADVLDDIAKQIETKVNLFNDLRESMIYPHFINEIEKTIDKLRIRDYNWYEDKTDITRNILQLYGTEIFRNRVNDNWWVNQVKNRAIASNNDVILVTDCRFPNEITGIYDDNYEVVAIRIERNINTQEQIASHDSETALDGWKVWDYIISNDGTLEDLKASAETIISDLTEEKEYKCDGLFTRVNKEDFQHLLKIST